MFTKKFEKMNNNITTLDLAVYVDKMKQLGLFRESRSDYIVMCPACYERHRSTGDTTYRKLKLYVDKGLKYSHCFRCGAVYLSSNDELDFNIKPRVESKIDFDNFEIESLSEDSYWSLSRFDQFSEYDESGVKYLCKRLYLYRDLYKLLKFRFHNGDIVIPFYIKNKLVYYQLRLVNDSKLKYYSPSISHKPPYIIENKLNNHFIICEGVFDAVAIKLMHPDATPFAVLGSDITEYQIAILRSYVPDKITVYMDKSDLSIKVKDKIQKYINYCDIDIIHSSGLDPEEYYRDYVISDLIYNIKD